MYSEHTRQNLKGNPMSRLLVLLQFIFIGVIAAPLSMPQLHWLSLGIFGAGLLVFAMAVLAMPMRTFTVMPEPKQDGELVTHGIYRIVRHPMYLAVLLCAIGACLAYGVLWKWIAAALLIGVLLVKIRHEEALLMQRFAAYADYRKRVKAIIPFVL
jgi:protein-S-isoprenylcysteine O-methyltransferase Ste14